MDWQISSYPVFSPPCLWTLNRITANSGDLMWPKLNFSNQHGFKILPCKIIPLNPYKTKAKYGGSLNFNYSRCSKFAVHFIPKNFNPDKDVVRVWFLPASQHSTLGEVWNGLVNIEYIEHRCMIKCIPLRMLTVRFWMLFFRSTGLWSKQALSRIEGGFKTYPLLQFRRNQPWLICNSLLGDWKFRLTNWAPDSQ